jgi:GTP pyrophosphokinase
MGNTAQKKKAEQKKKSLPQLLPANSRDSRLTQLLKPYLPQKEIKIIWSAYQYSLDAHKGQKKGVVGKTILFILFPLHALRLVFI